MKTFLFLSLLVGSMIIQAQTRILLPSDPQATPEAVNLFQRLMTLQQKGVMYGHQDDLMYGYTWWYEKDRSDIRELVGDYPAVAGFELGHLELGHERSLDSVAFYQMREQIEIFHDRFVSRK